MHLGHTYPVHAPPGVVPWSLSSPALALSFISSLCPSGALHPPTLLPMVWERINDAWYNYVKGHNPKDYFGIYDVVRFDTFWLDKA